MTNEHDIEYILDSVESLFFLTLIQLLAFSRLRCLISYCLYITTKKIRAISTTFNILIQLLIVAWKWPTNYITFGFYNVIRELLKKTTRDYFRNFSLFLRSAKTTEIDLLKDWILTPNRSEPDNSIINRSGIFV